MAVKSIQQSVMPLLPGPVRRALKGVKKWWLDCVADKIIFPVWIVFQCLRHRKRAVILRRMNALGDILCTLPMVPEIRRRHPGRLLVFATYDGYRDLVELSQLPDAIYGAHSWDFLPPRLFGLVEKSYAPLTTDERDPKAGTQCHLVDDLAATCGFTVADRQPHLFPSPELIRQTLAGRGLADARGPGRRLIGINCGRTWPVRMWAADRWQELMDRLHAEYIGLTIIQFGLTNGPADEFEQLRGVRLFASRLRPREFVPLVAACDLIISIDSGPVHVAGAVGVPVVGLFGAVNPEYRLPPASPAVGVFAEVPCRFCNHLTPRGHWQDGCPHNIRCMKELTVGAVFQAVQQMLGRPDLRQP